MVTTADFAIVGGGIVGLALADAWLERQPGAKVAVYEKEPRLGAHASGRNSGVLHAGFYYAPDSLKARLTRDGNRLLRTFCTERGVNVRPTGKVVVTTREDQLPGLRELQARGLANGVDVSLIDERELADIEPLARTVGTALWSPTTAVADPLAVIEAMAGRVRERGGHIHMGTQVTAAGGGWLRVSSGERVATGHVINAAGLYADVVAHWFGFGTDYRMLPFKGLYWYGTWSPGTLRRHVYPVPDPRNPFLGVHLTVTVDGRAKVGPTAIPALWREDYGGLRGFNPHEAAQIAALFPRFLRSPHHDIPALLKSELPKYVRHQLVRQVAGMVPTATARDFTIKGRSGVRAQLLHVPTGRLEMDFVVEGDAASTHILNAVSPAWTSSLAVGGYVVDAIMKG